MAVYTRELSTKHNIYPNLTVYDRFCDGVLTGWDVYSNEGYVMYDTNDQNTDLDEDGNEIPVTYYFTHVGLPLKKNWDNFSWVTVLRNEVDEKYISG